MMSSVIQSKLLTVNNVPLTNSKAKKWARRFQLFFAFLITITFIALMAFFPPLMMPLPYLFFVASFGFLAIPPTFIFPPLRPFVWLTKSIHKRLFLKSTSKTNSDLEKIIEKIKNKPLEEGSYEELGKGNSGEVFNVDLNGKEFAVKKIPIENESWPSFEASILESLSHPNVLNSIGNFLHEKNGYIVTEKLKRSLKECIQDNELFPSAKIKTIFSHLLNGLAYIHYLKLVHRDIKPGNLLLDKEGNLKIIDFGLSKISNEPSAKEGTPRYMAPEICCLAKNESERISAACDIYAAVLVIWELFPNKFCFKESEGLSYNHKKVILSLLLSFRFFWVKERGINIPDHLKNQFIIWLYADHNHKDVEIQIDTLNRATKPLDFFKANEELTLKNSDFPEISPPNFDKEKYQEVFPSASFTKYVLSEKKSPLCPFPSLQLTGNDFNKAKDPQLESSCQKFAPLIRRGLHIFPEHRPSANDLLEELKKIPDENDLVHQ